MDLKWGGIYRREWMGEEEREKLNYYLKNKQQLKAFFHVSLWVCLLSMSLKYLTHKKF